MPAAAFTEWLNANATRSFPFVENSSRSDQMGVFTIPNDFIASAQISIPRSYSSGVFFVSKLIIDSGQILVEISYSPGSSPSSPEESVIGSFVVDVESHDRHKYYSFSGQDEHRSVVGSICVYKLGSTLDRTVGTFTFDVGSTPFEPSCIYVSIPAVSSVEVYSSSSLIHTENDVLRLKAGRNVRLTYEDDDNKSIRIDVVPGMNTVDEDECDTNPFTVKRCIMTINGIPPDENGDFKVFGSECIEVEDLVDRNAIMVRDKCATSCCECDELEELVAAITSLKAKEGELRTYVENVQEQQAKLISNLASAIKSS